MAEVTLLTSITKKDTFPKMVSVSAPSNCGMVSLILDTSYTQQMIYEMPNIHIEIYTIKDGEYILYTTRALCLKIPENKQSVSNIIKDIPSSCVLSIKPMFDEYAFTTHNELSKIDIFNETVWTTPTETFPIKVIWDNSNISSGAGETSSGNTGGDNTGTSNPSIICTCECVSVKTVPNPSVEYNGQIIQYIGESDNEYTTGNFYKCELDEDNNYVWVNITPQMNDRLTEDIVIKNTIGGLTEGELLETGTPIESILNAILTSETIDLPRISLSIDPSKSVYGIGDKITSLKLTANVSKGSKTIKIIKYKVNDKLVHTETTNISEGGIFEYILLDPITSDTVIEVSCYDGLNTVTATQKLVFIPKYYYGTTPPSPIGAVDLSHITELIDADYYKKITFNADGEHLLIMYGAEYDDLITIRDENNLENINAWSRSIITIGSVSYKLYISNTPVTCTDFDYYIR